MVTQHQIFNEPPEKKSEPIGPKRTWGPKKDMNLAEKFYEFLRRKNRWIQGHKMFFCEPTKKWWTQGPQNSTHRRESRSMFCECIWGGGAAPSPPFPLQLFLLRPTSSGSAHPHLKRPHLQLKP